MGRLLDKAMTIAIYAHSGQVDKAGIDYIFHPLKVMLKLETEEEKIVAVLHDTIEDTDITYDYLREQGFTEDIIKAVESVTRNDGESYMDFIRRCRENPIGRKVKLADLEDNMDITRISNPTQKDYDRLKKYEKAKKELLKEQRK